MRCDTMRETPQVSQAPQAPQAAQAPEAIGSRGPHTLCVVRMIADEASSWLRRGRGAFGLRAFVFCAVTTTAACMPSAAARLGETANDYLIHLRFGRVGLLQGFENPESRAKLGELHRPLGRERQVTDVDILAVQAKDDVGVVAAQVSWYAPGEQLLRISTIEQRWVKGGSGTWVLDDESLSGGDPGFFVVTPRGELAPGERPAPSKELGKGAHFPTVRLGY